MEIPAGDLSALTARRLTNLLVRHDVSAREVAVAFLDRIAALDGALGAFVHLNAERALADAAAVDAGALRGPLHGLPIGIKDLFDVAGAPTTGGSALAPAYPSVDSEVVARLRAAGAILVGKLTTSEYGCGSAFVLRQPRNPWDRRYSAGGSSSGSAIAVAARMLPAAIGGDTGGSIRIPASFSGVVGYRPTTGAVPVSGSVPLAPGIDTAGPMTATVDDSELILRVIAPALEGVSGPEPATIISIEAHREETVDPEVAAAVDGVARAAARVLGLERRSLSSRVLELAWAGAWVAIYSAALAVHRNLLREHLSDLSRPLRWKLCAAAALTPRDIRAGNRIVSAVQEELSRLADGRTIVIGPTTSHPAHALAEPYAGIDTMAWTAGASLAGLPALSVPVGCTSTGLPIAVQFLAAPNTDLRLLGLAGRLERAGVIGGIGSPTAPSVQAANALPPLLSPPAVSVTTSDIGEIQAAAQRLRIRMLDSEDAQGAARSLKAVRAVLRA